jgi:hypothetical protein
MAARIADKIESSILPEAKIGSWSGSLKIPVFEKLADALEGASSYLNKLSTPNGNLTRPFTPDRSPMFPFEANPVGEGSINPTYEEGQFTDKTRQIGSGNTRFVTDPSGRTLDIKSNLEELIDSLKKNKAPETVSNKATTATQVAKPNTTAQSKFSTLPDKAAVDKWIADIMEVTKKKVK